MIAKSLGTLALVVALGGCSTSTISTLSKNLPNDGSTICADFNETISGFGFNESMSGHLVRSNSNSPSQGSDAAPGCAIAHGGSGGVQGVAPVTGVASVAAVTPVTGVTLPK